MYYALEYVQQKTAKVFFFLFNLAQFTSQYFDKQEKELQALTEFEKKKKLNKFLNQKYCQGFSKPFELC